MVDKKTRQEFQDEILDLKKQLPDQITLPKIFVTDTTPEGLQQELANNGGRSAVISDEGIIFQIMAGMYSDGKCNLDVFLQGHAGGSLRVKRKDRDIDLDPSVTFGLAIQPQVLSDLNSHGKDALRGRGLLARFLYCLPTQNIGKRDVRRRTSIPAGLKVRYEDCIEALLSVPQRKDQSGKEKATLLVLKKDALESWYDFSQWIESNQGPGGKFEAIQDFTGKLPGQALRIAALCHLAKVSGTLSSLSSLSPETEIDLATLTPVIELCKRLIVSAQIVFDRLEDDHGIADAKWALSWITSNVETDDNGAFFIRQSALHSSSKFKRNKLERPLKALEILRERNIISKQCKQETRKPTLVYYVNPVVFSRHS